MENELQKLFWDIYNSENEFELHEIVNENRFLANDKNWKPYGENGENNFSTFLNQQSKPIPALCPDVLPGAAVFLFITNSKTENLNINNSTIQLQLNKTYPT